MAKENPETKQTAPEELLEETKEQTNGSEMQRIIDSVSPDTEANFEDAIKEEEIEIKEKEDAIIKEESNELEIKEESEIKKEPTENLLNVEDEVKENKDQAQPEGTLLQEELVEMDKEGVDAEKFEKIKKNVEKQIEELIKDAENEKGKALDKKDEEAIVLRLDHYKKLKSDLEKNVLDVAYEVMEERNRLGDEIERNFRKRVGSLDAEKYEAERKLASFKIGNNWTPAFELAETVTERNFRDEFDQKIKEMKEDYESIKGEEARIAKKMEEIKQEYGEDLSDEAILQKRYGWKAESPKGLFSKFIYKNKAGAVELEVPVVFGRALDAEANLKIKGFLREEILKEIENEKESKAREFQRYQVQELMKILEDKKKTIDAFAGTSSKVEKGAISEIIENKGLEGIDLTKKVTKTKKPSLKAQIDNGANIDPEKFMKRRQGASISTERLRGADSEVLPKIGEIFQD
jgi:hypothetical protein